MMVSLFDDLQTLQDCEDALTAFQEGNPKEGAEPNGKTIQIDPKDAQECITKLSTEFESKMSDDMNTAHILTGAFQDALKLINSSINAVKVILKNSLILAPVSSHFFLSLCWNSENCDFLKKKQPKKQKQQKQKQQKQQDQQDEEEQQKEQQSLMIQSLIEVKEQVKKILSILGLLSSSTHSEVILIFYFFSVVWLFNQT